MKNRSDEFAEKLEKWLAGNPQYISSVSQSLFCKHFQLLDNWNTVHNLISAVELDQLVNEHYGDCVMALCLWKETEATGQVYDLGSGNGFPGILAAILFPQCEFKLVESSRKKCSFLRLAAAELGLKNVEVLQKRVETVSNLNVAMTRAAFSQSNLKQLISIMAKGGSLFLMTGPSFDAADYVQRNQQYWLLEKKEGYSLTSGAKRELVHLRKI